MTFGRINLNHFIGLILGLFLVNQSIRSLTYYNFIAVFFFLLLGIYFYKFIINSLVSRIHLNNDDGVMLLSYMSLIFYAFTTLYVTGFQNYIYFIELISLSLLYIAGRTINTESYIVLVRVILTIGLVHSLVLLLDRGYIYSSGVNYLLLSLVIGLYTCISLLHVVFSKSKLWKTLYIFLFIIGFSALFSIQSRAVFLIVSLFSFALPWFLLTSKNRLKVYGFGLVLLVVAISFFQDLIVDIYSNSVISERMVELFFNFEDEPRIILYSLYFQNFTDFFLTGYGINGTDSGVYSSMTEVHPHNFILEMISEFGLIGLLFSFIFIFRPMYIILMKIEKNLHIIIIATMYLYYLIIFMKSFTIYDSYALFFVTGIVFNRKLIFNLKKSYRIGRSDV
jgi:O-antigen ligase